MAPLRSSRSTRNQDHQAASRNRPGVVELDPTEGLPVQKWEQVVVRVNQDPSSEPTSTTNQPSGTTATSSAEWSSQFNTPQFPWPEKPLPSFFNQLPPWNQEMLRRARAGNTNAKLSVWDRKTMSWISAAEAEKRHNPLKSVHLNNLDQSNESKQENNGGSPAHEDEDDHEEKSDDEIDGDNADDDIGPTATTGAKRRKKYVPEERVIEVKRWVQMPPAVAEKTEERKFLADRRPGMPSLYGGAYQNQVFGSMGLNTNGYGFSAANAGYDLGDGGGLGNAGSMLGSNEAAATPVRKNMPPKRKKKKGGPGRKKLNQDPTPQAESNGQAATTRSASDVALGAPPVTDVTMGEGENEGSDSGSDGEGSEEGEIDEGENDQEKRNQNAESKTELQETTEIVQQAPIPSDEQKTVEEKPKDTTMADTEVAKATLGASDLSAVTTDVTMQDAPNLLEQSATEAPPTEQVEPEVIPSIIPPPVSEQLPEVMPSTDPAPLPEQDPIPQLPEPEPEPEPEVQTTILPEQEPQVQPPPAEPTPTIPTDQPAAAEIPTLVPIFVQPSTQLPPITTTVAEAMDQPSISAPVIDTTAVPAPAPQSAIEPTSPDLLGGLEDALNKGMDEQSGE